MLKNLTQTAFGHCGYDVTVVTQGGNARAEARSETETVDPVKLNQFMEYLPTTWIHPEEEFPVS